MKLSGEQEFTTEIQASLRQCFETITSFEQYPEWFSSVERTRVLQRYRNRLAKRVEYHVDMGVKSIRYVLEYTYEQPRHLRWVSVEGDVEAIEGSYHLEPLGPKSTRATCRQAVALALWIPAPIRTALGRQALKHSVLEFKAAAEQVASKPPARRRSPPRR